MLLLLWVALVAAAACSGEETCSRPLVTTREGVLRGLVARSAAGNRFYSFKGIRYAKPPVGPLRFNPPVRHPGWSGVADASEHGSRCLQFDFFKGGIKDGSEDCLFLNVYTPQLPRQGAPTAGLPVMVFIHGGGFTTGFGDEEYYGPKFLVDGDVVLVTFNYRLHAFGFVTDNDSSMPGNYGLLDQVLVLQWVRDNIAAFGGDPKSVTIFGQSAGGGCVSLLMLSPLAKGLFHHAISQSGASLGYWSRSSIHTNTAQILGKQVNCTTEELQTCLRDVDADTILDATLALMMSQTFFTPRIDAEVDSPFLPEDPRLLLERGDFNLVPWMEGLTQEEGSLFALEYAGNETMLSAINAGDLALWGKSALMTLDAIRFDCGADPEKEIEKVRDFYLRSLNTDKLLPITRLHSDRVFTTSVSEEIRLASAHTPVYKYLLDHTGPGRLHIMSLLGMELPVDFGPTHGDDLAYLFSSPLVVMPEADSPEYTMVRFMVSLWTSFARTGRPSSSVFNTPDWPIFTESNQRHMRLNSEPSLGERAFDGRVQFWKTVRLDENWRHPFNDAEC